MKSNNCIKNLLKFIWVLQNNSTDISCEINDCTKPFLGPSIFTDCYNTRVVTLYNKNGDLFTGFFNNGNGLMTSPYFRVQSVDDNCCTLLLLNNVDNTFESTRQTMTVNLNCICAVKCIEDVSINL